MTVQYQCLKNAYFYLQVPITTKKLPVNNYFHRLRNFKSLLFNQYSIKLIHSKTFLQNAFNFIDKLYSATFFLRFILLSHRKAV